MSLFAYTSYLHLMFLLGALVFAFYFVVKNNEEGSLSHLEEIEVVSILLFTFFSFVFLFFNSLILLR